MWWILWFVIGGIFGVIGDSLNYDYGNYTGNGMAFFIVPAVLFVVAVTLTIINTIKGKIYCPRCDFAKVIPEYPSMQKGKSEDK